MQRLRHILRTCLILALIPLTVFNGRASAGCLCSDGHFEPFCRGGSCCSRSGSTAQPGSCGCAQCCCQSKSGEHKKPCCRGANLPSGLTERSESEQAKSCCHPLTQSPMVPDKNFTPQFDIESLAFDHTVAVSLVPVVVEQAVPVYAVDSGPPIERLHVLQRLLI